MKVSIVYKALAMVVVCWPLYSAADTLARHGQSFADLREDAIREGELVVYSVTSSVPNLVEDFQFLYPEIELRYIAMDSTPLYQRVVSEAENGSVADIAWSSAMDLQVQLVNDGYAMTYESPELANIPPWAVWRNQAFGTSFEPVGFVYNTALLDASEVPRSRAEFIELITSRPEKFDGRIISFDPADSGLGYLLMTQDAATSQDDFWRLVRSMGCSDMRPQSGSGAMFKLIASGDALIGYNMLGSYALRRARTDLPELGLILPNDYTLVVSRVMFILRDAPHPNAAKLWLDYVLSRRGQQIISDSGLGSVRPDIDRDLASASLEQSVGKAIKPIAVDAGLLGPLDAAEKQKFLDRWRHATTEHCSATSRPD